MIGFIMYCSTPTRTAEVPSTTLPMADSNGFDNLALKIEENHLDSTDTLTTQCNKDNSQAEDTTTKLTALWNMKFQLLELLWRNQKAPDDTMLWWTNWRKANYGICTHDKVWKRITKTRRARSLLGTLILILVYWRLFLELTSE